MLSSAIRAHSLGKVAITTSNPSDDVPAALSPLINRISLNPLMDDDSKYNHAVNQLPDIGRKTCIKVPFNSSYTAMCVLTVPYTHDDSVKYEVLHLIILTSKIMAKLLTSKHLHREIREMNGAYGGGAGFSSLDGIFSFYSYRDPNPFKSMRVFEACLVEPLSFELSDEMLREAKLSILSKTDAPVNVESEGISLFHHGITDEMRQRFVLIDSSLNKSTHRRRDLLFAVEANDLLSLPIFRHAPSTTTPTSPLRNITVLCGAEHADSASGLESWDMISL